MEKERLVEYIELLSDVMTRHGLVRLECKESELSITLEKAMPHPSAASKATLPEGILFQSPTPSPIPSPTLKDCHTYITSPMVGTFYRARSPQSAPLVAENTQINAQQCVGIIEAMKIMNEIRSGKEGRIVEVLVPDGQPVEFGTKLFKIAP